MTISTLKVYDRKQPMNHEVCLTISMGLEKGHCSSHQLSQCPFPRGLCLAVAVAQNSAQLCRTVPSLSSCTPVITGTNCHGKNAGVAVGAPAALQLQWLICDCSDQHQLIDTWCSVHLCDLYLFWIILCQNCRHIRAGNNNNASISKTAASCVPQPWWGCHEMCEEQQDRKDRQSDPNALENNEQLCNTDEGGEEINNFVMIRKVMAWKEPVMWQQNQSCRVQGSALQLLDQWQVLKLRIVCKAVRAHINHKIDWF